MYGHLAMNKVALGHVCLGVGKQSLVNVCVQFVSSKNTRFRNCTKGVLVERFEN